MRLILLVSLLISGLAAAALAGEPQYSRPYKACMGAAGSVTMKMRECLSRETERWAVRSNRAYKALAGKLGSKQRKNLIAAQQAWRRYRKASCIYYASETGGSIDTITSNTCRLELTAHRTLELERLLKKHIELYGK